MNPKEKLEDRIRSAKLNVEMLNFILPILATFDGKKITKRIETKIKQALEISYPTYTSWYDVSYSMYHLNIRRSGHEMRILLGYHVEPIFKFEEFKYYNLCFSLDSERLIKYEQGLDKMDAWENKFNDIKNQLKDLKDEMATYGCEYMIDWRSL